MKNTKRMMAVIAATGLALGAMPGVANAQGTDVPADGGSSLLGLDLNLLDIINVDLGAVLGSSAEDGDSPLDGLTGSLQGEDGTGSLDGLTGSLQGEDGTGSLDGLTGSAEGEDGTGSLDGLTGSAEGEDGAGSLASITDFFDGLTGSLEGEDGAGSLDGLTGSLQGEDGTGSLDGLTGSAEGEDGTGSLDGLTGSLQGEDGTGSLDQILSGSTGVVDGSLEALQTGSENVGSDILVQGSAGPDGSIQSDDLMTLGSIAAVSIGIGLAVQGGVNLPPLPEVNLGFVCQFPQPAIDFLKNNGSMEQDECLPEEQN